MNENILFLLLKAKADFSYITLILKTVLFNTIFDGSLKVYGLF